MPVKGIGRDRGQVSRIRFGLVSTSSLMALTLLTGGPSRAEPAAQDPSQIRPIDVSPPRQPRRPVAQPSRPARQPQRVARPRQQPIPPPPGFVPGGPGDPGARTPLNTNVVPSSASRLGLTVREEPATIEVVDKQTIQDRGYRNVTETAQGVPGVTAGDFPAEPSAFSMRGFTNSQINTLYNGIRVGPQNMTSRTMDASNLERVEFLKGPASLMSGEGAAGGAVNFVTKAPHAGPVLNEAFISYDSFGTARSAFGSGGSTAVQGLDYRFDVSRSWIKGFIDDTNTNLFNISSQLNYRANDTFKAFVAFEYKKDDGSAYWGTPLVPVAFSGPFATSGLVSGTRISEANGGLGNLGPVTIDSRTFKTNYNVLDNVNRAEELWVRAGFEWIISDQLTLRTHLYGYDADREWKNNEISAFDTFTNQIYRERFFVAHQQKLYGDMTDLTWNSRIAGMDNRMVFGIGASRLEFTRPGAANFPNDEVPIVGFNRGFYGLLTTQKQTANIDNVYLTFEDRLKITNTFALIGGVRVEELALDRTSAFANGNQRPGFPFSKTWDPVTGRVGATWEAIPGLTFYGQYATGADVAANNLFLLGALQPLNLTTSRTIEGGLKQLFWNGRAEWTFAVFDIERKNVYAAAAGQTLNIAGRENSQGIEIAAAVRPIQELKVWSNVAFVDAKYHDYELGGGVSFSGNAPPNVPRFVFNAGASYRFETAWPVEVGATVRHVSDRFNTDSNTVKMLAYTVADAFVFVDIQKTRVAFRVRNLTDEKYVVWGDPFYPEQVLLGAPRSYEVSASFKF
jgi:iron complex outermembrane receptor protein